MKKIFALLLVAMMMVCVFASCGEAASDAEGDLAYIEEKGKLVVGITSYEPMNYQDENGEWTGFDTEFALAVGEKLDLDIEFKEIEWDNKWQELESKKIDCVWNGMTITEEAKANASVTDAYVINAQVIVCKAEAAGELVDAAALAGKTVAAEVSSAGYQVGTDAGLEIVEYGTQADAVMAVESGKADACIIDITMANAMTGEGTSYPNLTYTGSMSEEEYGIACRKDSDLTAKINDLMDELIADGTLTDLAAKYELTLAE
ncbi:MAG: transporter substrate-binding domain-containing protein [Clostridia bacterium]|nr:transporter substrate-binding domain-containing protein [Clostridia bacterium]